MGAEINMDTQIRAQASTILGRELTFYLPTTTGTQNIILAALGADSAEGELVTPSEAVSEEEHDANRQCDGERKEIRNYPPS